MIDGAPTAEDILGTVLGGSVIFVSPVSQQKDQEQGSRYSGNTFEKLVEGIAALTAAGQPGPYALILKSSVYPDTYSPLPETLVTVADRITLLVTGGFYATGALPQHTGLLISSGGGPVSLFGSQDVMTAHTQQNHDDTFRFMVFERVQFVVRLPAGGGKRPTGSGGGGNPSGVRSDGDELISGPSGQPVRRPSRCQRRRAS